MSICHSFIRGYVDFKREVIRNLIIAVHRMKNDRKVASIKLYTIKDLSTGLRNLIADIIYYK